ncbi:SGNH/GDSL hydrolase family protein [Streptomyces sp. WMMC500]|uniref:SGNH/GDSL hydrolase family protein n=1 Tax=Streptomyces sp. WMMC500 TaxID=3015154 RepID=UPI00248C75F5|nr:SGNH/GDSL hydrolase family protein [Streptomyces sp. WMMC500]WBB62150.1 SGNH/GDSL hydrolase family protein [Streptomyces sp. WMMC500]
MRIRLVTTATLLALAATAVPVAAQTAERPGGPRPLAELFDNTAVSDDADPGAADFDGAGSSFSARDLAAAGWTPGRTLDIDAAGLRLPRYGGGAPDNVVADGQSVALRGKGGPAASVSLLVAGSSPGAPGAGVSGTGSVRYADGSSSPYRLTAPDWRSGPLTTKALALPRRGTPEGPLAEPTRLYAVSVPVTRGKRIASLTLPDDPGPAADLHVFAVSVRPEATGWTGSWAASTSGYTAVGPWTDRTLRLVVHAGAGGDLTRVRLANTFAAAPVRIGHVTVAVQGEGAATAGRPVPLTFGGRTGTAVAAGAEAVSDPARFTVPPGSNLLVSIHLPETVSAAPVHALAMQTSYISAEGSGNRAGDVGAGAFTGTLGTWPFLTGIDVRGGPGSVVTLGDSITDGHSSGTGTNQRWPDVLSARLRAQDDVPRYGVLNQGISANRIVTDRYKGDGVSTDVGGVSAQHRLERDVLAQTSARTVVVFEGVNDVRAGTGAEEVIAGLRAISDRARERGLRVVAATIAPCEGFGDCTPAVDARRTAVNDFIRAEAGGADAAFDAMLDFDAVLRDPQRPQRLLPAYDSGDHLHPGPAGLKAAADSIDLGLLVPRG